MREIRKTSKIFMAGCLLLSLVLGVNSGAQAQFTPADLNNWTEESYPAVSGFGAGVWTVSGDGYSVLQSINGQPTLFYSDFPVFDTEVEGTIEVVTTGDDDFIGFALGFQPWDTTNPNADYLLVDWKQRSQSYNFGTPSCTPGSNAPAGLAVSRVFGIPTADEFWGHTNFDSTCSDLDNGLEQLARGINLGDTGWLDNTPYTFTFEYSATSLKVSVDGNLEIDITGNFNNGRLAFYNFSQANVKYNNYVVVVVNVGIDIEKLVSGDGGVTFFDANNCNDADVPFTVEDAVYKLIVTNWGQEAVTLDKIVDLDLGINLPLNPTVTIQPNDSVEFTNDAGQTQGLLQKEGACPNPDNQFENMATVSGTGDGSGDPVEATDPACVKCEPPPSGITRTLGYWKNHPTVIDGSFDGPGGFPGLLPLNFCGEYIVEPCDAVAFLSTDGGGINNFKRQGMAALLNCQAFGCPGDIFNLIADGSNACASGDMFDFDTAGFVLDVFNNSGDDLDLPFQSPPAYPKFCE